MADLKISALPAATTPLAGTEVLPIVQGSTTKKVAVSDLTAGRAVSAGDLSYTGTLTGSTGILNIGAGQLYKDASGRVGIATASPTASLSVGDDSTATSRQISLHGPASGANNGASINVRNGVDTVFALGNASNIVGGAYSSDAMLFWGNAALRFYGNGAERARIDNSGNQTLSTGNLVLGTAGKGITTGGATALGFGTNGDTAQAKIDTSGNFLISKTDADFAATGFEYIASADILRSTADGGMAAQFNRLTSDGAIVGFYRSTAAVGSISVTTTGTSYNLTSDVRLKHDIVDAPEASGLIDAIKVRSFKWNVDGSSQRYGFIAQELLPVAPEAVTVPEDEDKMMAVDYSKLVPMLVKEIQSLRARVAQLEGK